MCYRGRVILGSRALVINRLSVLSLGSISLIRNLPLAVAGLIGGQKIPIRYLFIILDSILVSCIIGPKF